MPTLPDEVFNLVEESVLAAREAAEEAAQAALNTLAVNRPTPYESMSESARQLRRALRAKARQLGGGSQIQGLQPLVEEIAYQQWHRMLFARFLAENDLLMHPTGVPVTLQDCAELAPEEGEADGWAVAAKYASEMLPGIFRSDDPVVQLRFAPEGRQELERILAEMPKVVIQADDSLGWMYQFWQSKKKEEVNASERKIGGADLAPVTQLFTEDYMVRFLLENSLGAWWAARHPDSQMIQEWEYLRFNEDGKPAAGTFPGWPEDIAEVTIMDPCCGSGHFLVAAFEMLRKMRMEAEDLSEDRAADAVIHDNLFGLEIDLRATQIAAFSVALAAWKSSGYREIPLPNIACSGIPVEGSLESWLKLAGNDDRLRRALTQLYQQFEHAPTLGSLIDLSQLGKYDPLITSSIDDVHPVLKNISSHQQNRSDLEVSIFGKVAQDAARAGRLLSNQYVLVVTNVPYLGYKKQSDFLNQYCDLYYPDSKMDLATVFIERCYSFVRELGSMALVTPKNWMFLKSYKKIRIKMLEKCNWNMVTFLGGGNEAFRIGPGNIARICKFIITKSDFHGSNGFFLIDVTSSKIVHQKEKKLKSSVGIYLDQKSQLRNPDSIVTPIFLESDYSERLLEDYGICLAGIQNGDSPKYQRKFWEFNRKSSRWVFQQTAPRATSYYDGFDTLIDYDLENGHLRAPREWRRRALHDSDKRGQPVWGKRGVLVNRMSELPCTLYLGNLYDQSGAVIAPEDPDHLLAIWSYCSSPEFNIAVRKIDSKLNVTNATLLRVPFNLEYWQKVAEESYPEGLPEPCSNRPTQWLFEGNLVGSSDSLHVAVARLLGYSWPEQKSDGLDSYVDKDGIACLTSVLGESPATDRLRALLQAAYGDAWSARKETELLAEVGFAGKTLRAWLRDGFFKQHVKIFKNRPFIWHIWDGRRDGFHALVNYHKMDAVTLDRLIYTYLGSWIKLQRDKRDLGEPGADGRLVAALKLQEKLKAIRAGEAFPQDAPPNQRQGYDIYVRWKSLAEQPMGWNPDLNDGVRLNIRPFVTAGVLRNKFTINWKKDRGKNPDGSERHNDLHFTIAEKRAARQKKQSI